MKSLADDRKTLVANAMENIRAIIKTQGVNRDALDQVKSILVTLSAAGDLFNDEQYPTPTAKEFAKIYLLSEDDGGDFSLYLISTLPTGPSPIHDHGTWAVIAGLAGDEENTLYKRLDDGSVAGKASIAIDSKVVISGGDAIAFLPDDIHHINAISQSPTRHFHLYGKGFDQQTERVVYNLKDGSTKSASGSFIPVDESRRIL